MKICILKLHKFEVINICSPDTSLLRVNEWGELSCIDESDGQEYVFNVIRGDSDNRNIRLAYVHEYKDNRLGW